MLCAQARRGRGIAFLVVESKRRFGVFVRSIRAGGLENVGES
jgi:hypothetical protein